MSLTWCQITNLPTEETIAVKPHLLKVANDIVWCMERHKFCAMWLIDFSLAFYMVNHQILLDVPRMKLGAEDTTISCFHTYLRPRFCKVNVEDRYSSDRDLQFSVPQGSLCGPVLYSVYASTLQEVVLLPLHINGFAYDHSFKYSFKASSRKDKLYTIRNIKTHTKDVKVWMGKNWKMNNVKTELILFGSAVHFSSALHKTLMLMDVLYHKVKWSNT